MSHNLSYPENVATDDQQGHYIMFMINETTPGKVAKKDRPVTFGTLDEIAAASHARDLNNQAIADEKNKLVFIDEHLNKGKELKKNNKEDGREIE